MLYRPPKFGKAPLVDKRDSETLAEESEKRGELKLTGKPDAALAKYNHAHLQQIAKHEDLLNLPNLGKVAFYFSQKDLNAYTLILWVLQKVGHIDSLFLTTFNINQDISRALAGLIDNNDVDKISIVISQSIEKRMPDRIEELRLLWETRQERMRVSLCWNHSKVALIAASDGQRFLITGSGNYSFNAELEQYEIWNSQPLYDWSLNVLERRCFSEARMNKMHKIWGKDEIVKPTGN